MVCLVRAVITRRLALSLVILEQVTSK